jgi:hypothetical protein
MRSLPCERVGSSVSSFSLVRLERSVEYTEVPGSELFVTVVT